MTATARSTESSADPARLFVAFDMGCRRWKLGSTVGMTASVRHKEMAAFDRRALEEELARAKRKWGLPADAPVVSCYEIGRDGFAPHRFFEGLGMASLIFDAASIEVPRRKRRAKTDRLDVGALLRLLVRHGAGERGHVRLVRVPSVEVEDARQLHREWETAVADRQRLRNRITSLIAAQGGRVVITETLIETLRALVLPDGRRVPPTLLARLERDATLLTATQMRLAQVVAERHRRVTTTADDDPMVQRVRHLMRLRGIGEAGAWLLVMEHFWRDFHNRREVGAAAGLTGTPFASGDTSREQGISKAGNARVRRLIVEESWGWIHWQPKSEITTWFHEHYQGTARTRRVGIVAVARRLLIALWRYLETGVVPAGAQLKVTRPVTPRGRRALKPAA